jgi:type IV pilus assembly protein PilC
MITFTYKARDLASNKIINSTVQAESEAEAGRLLMERNLVPLSIVPEGEKSGLFSSFQDHISTKDRVIFTRQLATLISAGLPLAQSLHTAQEQTANKKLKAVLQDIISSVEGGSTLAAAFEKTGIFSELFIALIAAGEVSGTLDKALERIANQQEKDAEIASKVRGAMVYPGIVLAVMVGVVVFMLTSVVPQIENLYKSLHRELPLLTKIMVSSAHILMSYWWVMIIVLVVGIFYLRRYVKTPAGKRQSDIVKLKLPLFGNLFSILYMARFTRTGETLLMSGVQMLEMLRIAGQSVGNVPVQEALVRVGEKIKNGKGFADSLKKEELILPLVSQMISIGEQSGSIDTMMGKAATFYENELDNAIKNISTAIEPLLMVCLAVVAGGMVGAILFPIYSLVGGGGIQ